MAITILVTGFGPFPGAHFNPTATLIKRLARLRRPALARTKIVTHIFETSYQAVDRDLRKLIARHRPDALLMFGLATRAKTLRVETYARNSLLPLADASGHSPPRRAITAGAATAKALPAPARRLLAAIRATGVPATRSRDAGRYLCNYLCWRAVEAATKAGGPSLVAFVHVPAITQSAHRRCKLSTDDLARAGSALLVVVAATCHNHGAGKAGPRERGP